MERDTLRRWTTTAALAALALLMGGTPVAGSSLVRQSFQLEPGWNAVYLEVQPEPRDIQTLFAGVPVAGVWTWNTPASPVMFIRNPSEGLLNRPGWLGYFPPGPEAFLTNLHTLQANRAYLVHLAGDAPVTWAVMGRPVARPIPWIPNSFNLVGFPVDPGQPPTFAAYLARSPAHVGQPVYRLGPAGEWENVANPHATRIRSGEAYWVYTQGASDFDGPVHVDVQHGDSLDYGATLTEKGLRLRNLRGGPSQVTVRPLPSTQPVPLSYWTLEANPDAGGVGADKKTTWRDLGSGHAVSLAAGQDKVLRLAVRRAELPEALTESVLEITDGSGFRRLLAVSARQAGATPGTDDVQSVTYEGLWIGSVSVQEVSEPMDPNTPTTPTPTGSPLGFRVMIHVDGAGNVRLLKQVTQMYADGLGRYVLVTDDALVPQYDGVAVRDGEPVGYRVSAVAYDFAGDTLDAASGSFGPGQTLLWDLFLRGDAPTNPFFHRYHPDHDEVYLDPNGIHLDPGEVSESYEVTRSWSLQIDAADPEGSPDWGSDLLTGAFGETISGVHRNAIAAAGTFRLRRVSTIPDLNP
jgi:hypothetical protein